MHKQTFYVTTPIYYGTARPHLGSLYSTLVADVINRWERLKGKETFFLTGTDEHGQKIVQAAQKAGIPPKDFVDSFIAAYKKTWHTYNIQYSEFIRTTDPFHIDGVQKFITTLIDNGDIYKDVYQGWYCTPCETFVSPGEDKKSSPKCISCGRETQPIAEESYFFRLSAYQERLLDFYTNHPDFITPQERFNEVISFVKSGLKDLSISRTTIDWGVPFLSDPHHIVYVWVDALCNYITAIGYGNVERSALFEKWWPANVQVLGKDIIRFHAVYWPAMLMAADLLVPRKLLVHGWIKIDKQKMSKSRGNVVDPMELAHIYGAEPVRYYLMRHIPVNADGDFNINALERCITADLVNDLGNLLNRMVSLAHKHALFDIGTVSVWHQSARALRDESWNTINDFEQYMDDYAFHLALARLWKFINKTNAYFHDEEPWKMAQKDKGYFVEVISATCHSLRIVAVLLWPILPEKMKQLLATLGHKFEPTEISLRTLELGTWHQTFLLKKAVPLFQKIEKSEKESQAKLDMTNYITIDDVKKVVMKIGTIVQAEAVPQSEKLIKMQVNLGSLGQRQVIAGIAKSYKPKELIDKQGIFVCNLEPRTILGLKSEGMMLVAYNEKSGITLVVPEERMQEGTSLQ